MDIGLAHSATEEAIANLIIGIGAIALGCWQFNGSRRKQKARLAQKFGLSQDEVDRLFRPVENGLFLTFWKWQSAAVVLVGISRLGALVLGHNDHGICALVMLFAVLNLFVVAGLACIFTGRAQYYVRRLMWLGYGSSRDRASLPSDKDSCWETLNILGMRLFGVLFLSIILGVIYLFVKAGLGQT